jgi:SAM-dependent methyltransferase
VCHALHADGTDKGHDDHKYTDLYHALFEPIRDRVANVTEIGIAAGQSLQVWHDYFASAHVWGVDIHPKVIANARRLFADKPRVHVLHANSKSKQVHHLGLTPRTMDIIIDDGDHYPPTMEKTLHKWWPYVRPGGYYCIEDVATGANKNGQRYGGRKGAFFFPDGSAPLVHNETYVTPETRRLFHENDLFFVDTHVGHRAHGGLLKALGLWMKDRVNHLSHVLVIRKRETPRTRRVESALVEHRAMRKVRSSLGADGLRSGSAAAAASSDSSTVGRRLRGAASPPGARGANRIGETRQGRDVA